MMQKRIGRPNSGFTFDYRRVRATVASDEGNEGKSPIAPENLPAPGKVAPPVKPVDIAPREA